MGQSIQYLRGHLERGAGRGFMPFLVNSRASFIPFAGVIRREIGRNHRDMTGRSGRNMRRPHHLPHAVRLPPLQTHRPTPVHVLEIIKAKGIAPPTQQKHPDRLNPLGIARADPRVNQSRNALRRTVITTVAVTWEKIAI